MAVPDHMRESCLMPEHLHSESLKAEHAKKGADAVVGIDIDYEVLGPNGGMLMVTASGTAVKLG